jgi:hypothetical protein
MESESEEEIENEEDGEMMIWTSLDGEAGSNAESDRIEEFKRERREGEHGLQDGTDQTGQQQAKGLRKGCLLFVNGFLHVKQ